MFGEVFDPLSDEQRADVLARVAELAQPYVEADGVLRLPARSLVRRGRGLTGDADADPACRGTAGRRQKPRRLRSFPHETAERDFARGNGGCSDSGWASC